MTGRPRFGRPLLALLFVSSVLAVLIGVRIRQQADSSEQFFDLLLLNASAIDTAALLSGETLVGASALDDHGVALGFGDALVRWQLAKRVEMTDSQRGTLVDQLNLWLHRTDLRGSGLEWADGFMADSEAPDPDAKALRSLRRSLPDGKVEAGRWLAALRLWPQAERQQLTLARRKSAFNVLAAAQLMRTAPDRLPVLLTQATVSAGDLTELSGLATEFLLEDR